MCVIERESVGIVRLINMKMFHCVGVSGILMGVCLSVCVCVSVRVCLSVCVCVCAYVREKDSS